jgi:hypothetical protein
MLLALPVARLREPLRTSVLVPLVGVLAVATTWFGRNVTDSLVRPPIRMPVRRETPA